MSTYRPSLLKIAFTSLGVAVLLLVGYLFGPQLGQAVGRLGQGASTAGAAEEHHDHHDEEHHHDHEEPAVSTTHWGSGLEVYTHHPCPVAGEPFELAVHLTQVESGRPVTSGSVSMILRGPEGADIQSVAETSASPGLFLLELDLPTAGTYPASLSVEAPEVAEGAYTIDWEPIEVFASEEAAHEAGDAAAEEADNDVVMTKEQQWRIGLRSEVLQPQPLAERLVVPGRVVAPHPSEAMVPPPVKGRILAAPDTKMPQVGDQVRAGQMLAVIEPSVAGSEAVQLLVNQAQLQTLDAELAAKQLDVEASIASAKVDLESAQESHQRLGDLAERGTIPEKRLIEARYALQQAEARLAGLQKLHDTHVDARQQLADFFRRVRGSQEGSQGDGNLTVQLRSPIDGTVIEAHATPGEFVDREHPLFRIVDLRRLYLDAEVSEYDVAKVEKSPGAAFRLSAYPDRIIPILRSEGGRLLFVGNEVDLRTRTVSVRYEVPNPEGLLRIGMFADVMIEIDRRPEALAVPVEAVVEDSGEPIVYVQTGGESFERRPVRLGIRDGDLLEIVDGLKAGQRLVVEGAYTVKLSTLSSAIPEHHHH